MTDAAKVVVKFTAVMALVLAIVFAVRYAQSAPPTKFDTGSEIKVFANPVHVPVVPLNQQPYVVYGYDQTAAQYAPGVKGLYTADDLADMVAQKLAERIGPEGNVRALAKPSLVQQACAKCHSGDEPKGGFTIEAMGDTERLAAIRRVTIADPAKRMPKGTVLSPEQIGALIGELSAEQPAQEETK